MLVAILIMFCSCSTTNNKLIINSKNVTKITVNYRSVKDNTLKTTENKDEILSIINYINSLKLKKITEGEAGIIGSSAYIITVYFNDKTSKEYIHSGNAAFKESGKDWYKMEYNQAKKFDDIYKSIGNK